jgi:hypothetical protein
MTGSLFSKTHIAENTTTTTKSLLIYSHSLLLLSCRSVFKQPFVHWMCIEQNKLDEKKDDYAGRVILLHHDLLFYCLEKPIFYDLMTCDLPFLEHIFKKWVLLKSFCRPSVSYSSAALAPRELKFSTRFR